MGVGAEQPLAQWLAEKKGDRRAAGPGTSLSATGITFADPDVHNASRRLDRLASVPVAR